MVRSQVTLEVSAFLDSPQAQSIQGPTRAQVQRIAEQFVDVCYEDLGKAPRFLDGHDMHGALGHALPARFRRKDPLAEHVPAVLRSYLEFLTETAVVTQAFEVRNSLENTLDEFQQTVRTGQNAHHHGPKQETVQHKVAKTGRNDPCVCGSGKKFKKCCGKNS